MSIGNLGDASEQDTEGCEPEGNLSTPLVVDRSRYEGTKSIPNIDAGRGERGERYVQGLVSVFIIVVAVIVFKLSHCKDSIVVGIVISVYECSNGRDRAKEVSPAIFPEIEFEHSGDCL